MVFDKKVYTAMVMIGLWALLIFFGSLNMKQVSYISRLSMIVLFAELLYINLEIIMRVYILKQNGVGADLRSFDKPMVPNFFIFMASSAGQYEGNPIIPAIYSNSRSKKNVSRSLSFAIGIIASYVIISSPLSIEAFGNKVQEIIFMNLDSSHGF